MHPDSTPLRGQRWGNRLLIPCEHCGEHFLVRPAKADRKHCSLRCRRLARSGTASTDPVDRFWTKVAKSDGCWLWQASVHKSGYGKFGMGGKVRYAHRMAWEFTHGPIPPGLRVLHRCDVPLCCNPDHLFLGTDADNTHDMMAKGRQIMGPRSRFVLHPEQNRGSLNPAARYTEDEVREMRRLRGQGVSLPALVRQFGGTMANIGLIVRGKTWKHVKPLP